MKPGYTKIGRFPALLAVLALLSAPASGGLFQNDDDLVRKGYLNLMLYHSAGKRAEAADERREHVPHDDIDIHIFNSYTGYVREFADRRLFDLVSPPTDEMIQLSRLVRSTDKDPTHYLVYEARWVPGHYVQPSPLTFGQWLEIAGYTDVERMTTYEVRVRLDGREKIYRAFALHHKPPQMMKDAKIEYIDLILGNNGALTELTVEDRPAFGAPRRGPARKNPPTKPGIDGEPDPRKGSRQTGRPQFDLSRLDDDTETGLSSDRMICDALGVCCPTGYTSLSQCCSGPMGLWSEFLPACTSGGDWDDVFGRGDYGGGGFDDGDDPPPGSGYCPLKRFYANVIPYWDSNSLGHIFGSHGGSSTLQGYCDVEPGCRANCNIKFSNIDQYETGMLTLDIIPPLGSLFRHSVGPVEKHLKSASGYVNGNNTPPSCAAGVAFTVKLCFLGIYCSHSVTFGGSNGGLTVSTTDSPYLFYNHLTSHTCPRML